MPGWKRVASNGFLPVSRSRERTNAVMNSCLENSDLTVTGDVSHLEQQFIPAMEMEVRPIRPVTACTQHQPYKTPNISRLTKTPSGPVAGSRSEQRHSAAEHIYIRRADTR